MAQLLSGTRVYGTATIDTQLLVNGTQTSVSTNTGAIQVVGGIGVGNSVFVGNALTVTNLVRVIGNTNATTTQTGALQVVGGVGIGQDLRVGGTIYGSIVGSIVGVITTASNLANGTVGQVPFQVSPGVTGFFGPGTAGQLLVSQGANASGPLYVNTSSIYVGRAVQGDNLSGGTVGAIPYQTGDNATTFLPIGNASFILASTGSAPVWVSTASLIASAAETANQILMSNESADSNVNYITFVSTTTGYTSLKGHATDGITYKPSTKDFGIGISSPLYKLHVTETANDPAARFERGGSGNVVELYNTTGATGDYPSLGFLHKDSASNAISGSRIAGFAPALAAGAVSGGLYFYTRNAGTEALVATLDKDGNFGLGITPTNKLDVSGTARISGITSITNTTAGTSPTTGALVVSGGVGVNASVRIAGQFISTQANNAATGSAQIYLNGATGNRIDFNQNGVGAPTFTTRSVGAKLVLYPAIAAAAADYALGIEGSTLWFGVPATSQQFRWYGGTTLAATLSGTGDLTLVGDLAVNGGDLTTTAATFNLVNTNATTVNFAGAGTAITVGAVSGTTTVRNVLAVSNATAATSISTGALTVAGGAGITGDLYVGGTFYGNVSVSGTITTATNIAGGTAGQVPYQSAPGVTAFFGPGTAGNVLVSNGAAAPTYNNTLALSGTTAASSPTTGALTVAGGAGVNGALYTGGLLNVGGTGAFASDVTVGSASRTANSFIRVLAGDAYNAGFEAYGNAQGTGYLFVGQSSSYGGGLHYNGDGTPAFATGEVADNIAFYNNNNGTREVVFQYPYNSTQVSFRGNIVVAGDAAVNGGDLTTTAATFNLLTANATTVNFAQAATTLSMGAVTGTTTVRNNLIINGNLTVQGTTTQVNSTVTNVSDPIFTIGTGPAGADPSADDNKDRGIAFKWHNGTAARTGFFGFDDSTGFFTFIPQATITNELVSGTRGAVDVNLAGGATGSMPYQSAANTTQFLPIGTENKVLTSKSGLPSWEDPSGITAGVATQVDMTNDNASTVRHFVTFVSTSTGAASVKASASTGITWIPSSKYFGLGIENPGYPLHINVDSGLASIGLSGTAANAQTMKVMQGVTGVENGGFSIYDVTSAATRFAIGSTGNIGIGTGTQNPTDRVHISNSGGTASLRVGDTVSTQVGLLLQRRNGGIDTQTHWFNASANSPWYLFGQNLIWTGERAGTVTPTHSYKPYYEAFVPISGYKEFGFVNATSGAFTSSGLIPNMVLKNDGNVGIGTNNPQRSLHVVSSSWNNVTGSGVIIENSNTVGAGITLKPSASVVGNGTSGWAVYAGGPGSAIGDGNLGFWAHGDNQARVTVSRSGNVGVGTSSAPVFTSGSGIEIQRSGTATLRLDSGSFATELYGYTGGTGLFQLSAGYLDLGTSNSTRLRILSNGDIGIGTNSPTARLHVLGNGDPTVNTVALRAGLATHNPITSTQQYGIYVDQLGGRYAPQTGIYVNVNNPNGLFGGPYYGIDTYVTSSSQAYQRAHGIRGRAENLTANYGTQAYGVVGVGISAEQGGGTIVENGQGAWGGHFTAYGKGNAVGVYADAYLTTASITGAVAIPLLVASNSVELLRVGANGNVGIGLNNPASKLHVSGDVRVTGITTVTNTTNASSTITGAFQVVGGAGIGGNLHVGGTITAGAISGTTTNATNVNITNETASASTHYLTFVLNTGNQPVKIDNAELAFIPSTGRLGVGTVSPGYKLDVNGEIRQSGQSMWFDGATINLRGDQVFNFLTDAGSAQSAKFKSIQVSTSYSGTLPDNGILFSTDSTLYRSAATTLRTNSTLVVDGNLGVNDTAPNIRLSILQNADVWHARFGATATTKQLRIGGNAPAGPVIGAYNTGDNTSPSALMINRDGGQVIIGSSTAFATSTVPLYVRGGANGWVVFERNSKQLYINANYSDTNTAAQISPPSSNNMALSLSARETLADLYLTTAGRVGMGTTSPLTTLDVRFSNSGTQSPQVNGLTLRTSQGNGLEWHLANSNGYQGWVAAARVNSSTSGWGSGYLEFITAGASGGNQQSTLTLHGNGNVTIGQVTASDYKLFVNGSFAATTKSFVIEHPSKAGWKLRYASLEGPENGVYIRGRLTNNNVIQLPDYWRNLVDVNSITVDITPVGKFQKLYVEKIQPHYVLIATESDQPVNCFYTVYAERKDVDKLVVEYEE